MKSILSIALVALMLPAPLLAQQSLKRATASDVGGADPGGGGLVRQGNRVKTMAEAGLVLESSKKLIPSDAPEYYLVSEATKVALRAVIEKLPLLNLRDSFYKKVLGLRGNFFKLSSVNKEVFAKIRDDYARLVRKQGKHLDEANFVLPAFSTDDGKTYIIADVFDKELSNQQQALILIHEYFMRSAAIPMNQRLAKVLQLDAFIYRSITQEGLLEPVAMGLIETMMELAADYHESKKLHKLAITQKLLFLQARDEAVLLSDLLQDPNGFMAGRGVIDSSMVKTSLEPRSPGIEKILRGVKLEAGISSYLRDLLLLRNPTRADIDRISAAHRAAIADHCQIHAETLTNSDVPEDRLIFVNSFNKILVVKCGPMLELEVELSGLQ